jgi:hypothetical protein
MMATGFYRDAPIGTCDECGRADVPVSYPGIPTDGGRRVCEACWPNPARDDLSRRLDETRVDLIEHGKHLPDEPPWVPGLAGMMQRPQRVNVFGEAKMAGKSLAIGVVSAVDVVEAGGSVVILDRENGADEYADRLRCVVQARGIAGERLKRIRERMRYHAWTSLKLDDGDVLPEVFVGVDLVIFDSSRKHTSALGLAEDKSDDYARFTDRILDPLMRPGPSWARPASPCWAAVTRTLLGESRIVSCRRLRPPLSGAR